MRRRVAAEDQSGNKVGCINDDVTLEAALASMQSSILPDSSDCRRALVAVAQYELRRHPAFRRAMRDIAYEEGEVSTQASQKGLSEIDGLHPAFGLHALAKKPLRAFLRDELFGSPAALPDAKASLAGGSRGFESDAGGYLPGGSGDSISSGGGDG